MKGYKGFKKGLICKDKQYAENTVFEEEEAVICKNGMHFCKNPFDVLDYYGFVDENGHMNEFSEVEALADTVTYDEKKFCTTKLKVGAKLSFAGFIKACIDFVMEKTAVEVEADENDENVICSKEKGAQICSSGDSSKIGSSGDSSKICSSGDSSKIGSSGYYSKIGSSGDSSKICSSGDYSQIDSTGEDSVICCAGHGSVVKAKKGSWITLAEWKHSDKKKRWVPVCVKTEYVDGERIKEDTFYRLVNGEFKEVN
nr:MAG TPA: hypothetical protein [Caudoviricetes sp.]